MLEQIKSLFSRKKKEEKSTFDIYQETLVGSSIRLIFKDPRKLGLIDPSGALSRRYDPEDLDKRIIIGTLLTKKNINGIFFVEIGCFKMRNGMRIERTYTFLLEEVEKLEII